MNALLAKLVTYWHPEQPQEVAKPKPPQVGDYKADYSDLTAQEIAATDPACEELFKNSQPVSRQT